MTVIDEVNAADEYDDMEFVEFLEFIVRIAFHQYLGEDRSTGNKLTDLLKEMLTLTNFAYQDPPKHHNKVLQSQASDADVQAFHRFVSRDI